MLGAQTTSPRKAIKNTEDSIIQLHTIYLDIYVFISINILHFDNLRLLNLNVANFTLFLYVIMDRNPSRWIWTSWFTWKTEKYGTFYLRKWSYNCGTNRQLQFFMLIINRKWDTIPCVPLLFYLSFWQKPPAPKTNKNVIVTLAIQFGIGNWPLWMQ